MIPHAVCFVKLYLKRSAAISFFLQFDEVSDNFELREPPVQPIYRSYVQGVFMTVGSVSN